MKEIKEITTAEELHNSLTIFKPESKEMFLILVRETTSRIWASDMTNCGSGHVDIEIKEEIEGMLTYKTSSCLGGTRKEKINKSDCEFTIVNLTPHDIWYWGKTKTAIFRKSELPIPRVEEEEESRSLINGMLAVKKHYAKTIDLPNKKAGTIYIVSLLVIQANPERNDLICPDTGPDGAVRDSKGNIMGVKRFQTS